MGLSPVGKVTDDSVSASTLTETVAAVDPTTASGDEVVTALERVDQVLSGLAEDATSAAEAKDEAAADLEAASAAVDELERQVADDGEPSDKAVSAAVAPPAGVLDGLSGRALAPATGRASLASWQGVVGGSTAGAPTQAALAAARRAEDEAAARAEAEAEEAVEASAALADARARGTEFVTSVEQRVSTHLDEAEAVAKKNPDEAEAVRAEETPIATSLEEIAASREQWEAAAASSEGGTGEPRTGERGSGDAEGDSSRNRKPAPRKPAANNGANRRRAGADRAAARRAAAEEAARWAALTRLPDPTGSASGALAGAWCSGGRRIIVDSSLGGPVQALINDAAAGGVGICAKSAFRPAAEQIELRRQNCGTSEYAVFHASPSTCSPPTARPGTSNHEDGLAVDFSCDDGQPMTHASPCFRWLAGHAAHYGLYNLPSEPWHWSVTGG